MFLNGYAIHPSIFAISAVVFAFLNILENLIHYTIGRFSSPDSEEHAAWALANPSLRDWIKILVITAVFAFLQGTLVYYLKKISR